MRAGLELITAVGRPTKRVFRSKQLAKLASGGIGDYKAARHCETLPSRAATVRHLPDDLICTLAKNVVVCRVSHCSSRPRWLECLWVQEDHDERSHDCSSGVRHG